MMQDLSLELGLNLNREQMDAVLTEVKHVLILAGAGSGKTRTITSRIIHLLKNLKVHPSKILALTFTNKAAGEMKERVINRVGEQPGLLLKTFHSYGAMFLRRHAEGAGRRKNFIIYDDYDANRLVELACADHDLARSDLQKMKKWIKKYKQNLEDESLVPDENHLAVYQEYNRALLKYNAFDFEDLILWTVKLLSEEKGIADYYRNRYEHILVDEYQDTNCSQNKLLSLLSGENLMVVGDEDQSIYKFRGAEVDLILQFPNVYSDTQIIRLEQNYRSTGNILRAANAVIANNQGRLGKTLYSTKGDGSKIRVLESGNETEEAVWIAKCIRSENYKYADTAILVRINAQTRVIEEQLRAADVPYLIVGGISFYEREEVKDGIALLRWFSNPYDRVAFERFANKPSRGIGKKSMEEFLSFAGAECGGNLLEALSKREQSSVKGKALKGLEELYHLLFDYEKVFADHSLQETFFSYLERLRIIEYYTNIDRVEGTERVDNLGELVNALEHLPAGLESISVFLEENALVAQADRIDDGNSVKVMTIHNAKGLEFDHVFISGLERELFPHMNSLIEYFQEGLEEERRLFYVAVTRAKENLFLCYTASRFIHGTRRCCARSQFLDEIPEEFMELIKTQKSVRNEPFDFSEIRLGDMVKHREYGNGKVLNLRMSGRYHLAVIDFYDYSTVEVILEYTRLEIVDD